MADGQYTGEGGPLETFGVMFTAEKGKKFDATINDVEKKIGKIPEQRKLRVTGDFENRVSPQLQKAFKDWDRTLNRKLNNPFKIFMNKGKMADLQQFFGKLKLTTVKAIEEYNDELDKIQGDGGELGLTDEAIENQKQKMADLTTHMEELVKKRDKLLKQKQKQSLLPSEKDIIREAANIQKEMNKIDKKINDSVTFDSPIGRQNIKDKYDSVLAEFDDMSKKAVAIRNKTGNKSYETEITKQLQQQAKEYKDRMGTIQKQLEDLRMTEIEAENKVQDTKDAYIKKPNEKTRKEALQAQAELKKVQTKIKDLNNQRISLSIFMDLNTDKYKQHLKNIKERKNNEIDNNPTYKTEQLPNQFQARKRSMLREQDVLSNYVGTLDNDNYIQELRERYQDYTDMQANVEIEKKKAKSNDKKKAKQDTKIGDVNNEIKDTQKEINGVQKEMERLYQIADKLEQKVKDIILEINSIYADMKGNPLQNDFTSKTLQPMNKEADKLNSKWSAFIGQFKNLSPIGKVIHKVMWNIYSQIATFVNPLNQFKKAWDSWINRWDNLPIKNTFEVISYNLVTVMQPLLEKFATLLVKLASIANVFTKKWFNVDLFDKAAWQTEKMKKNVGAMTASFDELHSSTDNPNEFNTGFDTGILNEDTLLGDKLKSNLEKFAGWASPFMNKLGKVVGWAFEHPVQAALLGLGARILGPTILKGAGKLIGKGLKKLFFGSKAKEGAEAGGSVLGKLFGKTLYTGMNDKAVTVGKLLGGIALTAGGTAVAISNAAYVGKNWQDLTNKQKAVKVGFVGLGSAAAGLGAVMLGASGPVGWAVAGTVALGSFVVGMSQTQNGIKSLKKETKEWQEQQEAMNQALYIAEQADSNYNNALANLRQIEEQTGESGKLLYEAVQNGSLSVQNMTSSQLKAYEAYKKVQKALEEQTEARKKANEEVRKEAKEHADVIFKNAKKSKSYDELAEHINTCWKNGTMTTEEARDEISRCMADMSKSARKELLEKLQPALQEGLDYEKYQNGWNKFGRWWENFWTNAVGVHDASVADMRATEESLIETTDKLREAQENLKKAQDELSQAEQQAGMTWDELKTKLDNGELAVNNLTDAQRKLYDAHINVSNSSVLVDQAMANNEKQLIGVAKQTYQTSGDWKAFIDKLVQANKDGQISTETMSKEIGIAMGEANRDTEQFMREYAKGLGIMTNDVEKNCSKQKGFFSTLLDNARDTWQRICNWFGGKGWNTNAQIQIDTIMNDNSLSDEEKKNRLGKLGVRAYDVGTNYVPNDQLAMIHQGEAIIPKKYNKPYQPSGDSSALYDTINMMSNEISQLRSLIQQGIPVKGEFKQRGSDLVAVVEKGKNKNGNQPLSNPAYAR